MSKTNKQIAEDYIRAVERGDTDALAQFMTDDFVQIEYPNTISPHGQTRGVAGCIEGAKKGQAILQWQRYELRSLIGEGDWVALDTSWVGKLSVAIGSMPVGYEMKAEIGMFLQFRDGKICLQRNYDCYPPL